MSFLKKRLSKLKPHFGGGDSGDNSSNESVPTKEGGVNDAANLPNGNAMASVMKSDGASTPERSNSRRQSRERRSIDKERAKEQHKKKQSLARIEDEKFLQEGPEGLTSTLR